ncbi:hypothetical protein C8R44DRAFT_879909 [Mycena epipterygia]|nr:hypothetical protein C8R44DRAFT_879909 [Mycena epipterygia]
MTAVKHASRSSSFASSASLSSLFLGSLEHSAAVLVDRTFQQCPFFLVGRTFKYLSDFCVLCVTQRSFVRITQLRVPVESPPRTPALPQRSQLLRVVCLDAPLFVARAAAYVHVFFVAAHPPPRGAPARSFPSPSASRSTSCDVLGPLVFLGDSNCVSLEQLWLAVEQRTQPRVFGLRSQHLPLRARRPRPTLAALASHASSMYSSASCASLPPSYSCPHVLGGPHFLICVFPSELLHLALKQRSQQLLCDRPLFRSSSASASRSPSSASHSNRLE